VISPEGWRLYRPLLLRDLPDTPAKAFFVEPPVQVGDGDAIGVAGGGVDELPIAQVEAGVVDVVADGRKLRREWSFVTGA